MKSKLLPILLVVLVLLNGVLIFKLITKTNQNKKPYSERNFLITELKFSDSQETKFIELDVLHKKNMERLSDQIRLQKDILFNSFNNAKINVDSIVNISGKLEAAKDLEVLEFFKSVRKICSPEQQEKFDKIISKAIRGNKKGPPRNDGNPPPRKESMHHPPHPSEH